MIRHKPVHHEICHWTEPGLLLRSCSRAQCWRKRQNICCSLCVLVGMCAQCMRMLHADGQCMQHIKLKISYRRMQTWSISLDWWQPSSLCGFQSSRCVDLQINVASKSHVPPCCLTIGSPVMTVSMKTLCSSFSSAQSGNGLAEASSF